MKSKKLQWVVAKLGEDFNWWVTSTSAEGGDQMEPRGILDPRQVAHLVEVLHDYRRHGLHVEQVRSAFQMFALESEIAEGQARLRAVEESFGEDQELFALPVLDGEEDGEGAYGTFLDVLSTARIHLLNGTHQYARPCTVGEMEDDLVAVDSDRYFSAEVIHTFDEINEILEWSIDEWDESSS